MKNTILATVGGLVAAVVVVWIGEFIGHQMYPPPADLDLTNKDDIASMIESAPTGAFVLLFIAHAIAAFVGGLVAGKISKSASGTPALVIGGLLTLAGLANLIMIPGHPVWFWVLELLAYLPAAIAGYRTGNQSQSVAGP